MIKGYKNGSDQRYSGVWSPIAATVENEKKNK